MARGQRAAPGAALNAQPAAVESERAPVAEPLAGESERELVLFA